MACTYTTGIGLNCRDFVGGIKRVYFGHSSDFSSGVTVTAHEVTALPVASVYTWEFAHESAKFEQSVNSDVANNTLYFEQKLTIPTSAIVTAAGDATKIALIDSVVRESNVIFVMDHNDAIYMMGRLNGAYASGGSIDTGQGLGDFNGYNLEFVAREKFQAEVVDAFTAVPFDNFINITVV